MFLNIVNKYIVYVSLSSIKKNIKKIKTIKYNATLKYIIIECAAKLNCSYV